MGLTLLSISLFLHQTLIHLVDRKTGKEVETKYYTGAMVLYHHVNAFEDDGHVVFDVIAYTDNSLYDMFYLSNLKEKSQFDEKRVSKPAYKRFALPIHADKVSCVHVIHLVLQSNDSHIKGFHMSTGFRRAFQLEGTWWNSSTRQPALWRRKKANSCAKQRCSVKVKPTPLKRVCLSGSRQMKFVYFCFSNCCLSFKVNPDRSKNCAFISIRLGITQNQLWHQWEEAPVCLWELRGGFCRSGGNIRHFRFLTFL